MMTQPFAAARAGESRAERIGRLTQRVLETRTVESRGRVVQVIGLVIESEGPLAAVGDLCRIDSARHDQTTYAEVVGFRQNRVLLMPLGGMNGIHPGSEVIAAGRPIEVPVGDALLGRVLDGLGRPLDGGASLENCPRASIHLMPPHPLQRAPIRTPLATGIKCLDTFIPCGRGQRLGIFAGSGVGKSTLLGMMAGHAEADVNVIALIGERGREVREFIEKDLDAAGRAKSVVVVATSNEPPLVRLKGAFVAMAIAEQFRNAGKDVLLMMDSVTRFAMAQREIGLAVGEPPATRGYTPSVFALLPQLLERAGTAECGSITGLFTVLVEGDDMNDPIADAVRSILDGHVVLSRDLAALNQYPAVDVLASVSRLGRELTNDTQRRMAARARELLAIYRKNQDLINIGAYTTGSNPEIDAAIRLQEPLKAFLRQAVDEPVSAPQAWKSLEETLRRGGGWS